MSTYDLYGSESDDLRTLKSLIEARLGIRFDEREGTYNGGIYYSYGNQSGEHFMLKRNVDPFDGDAAETDFPKSKIVFYVNETTREAQIKAAIDGAGGLSLLRHEEFAD